jgi:hypothetical protein
MGYTNDYAYDWDVFASLYLSEAEASSEAEAGEKEETKEATIQLCNPVGYILTL